MEDGGGEDENRSVDEEREHQRGGGVDVGEADGFALAGGGARVVARLDDGGVQVEVVRHDGRAEDADGDVEHFVVGDDGGGGDEEVVDDGQPVGVGAEDLDAKEHADGADEGDDEGFEIAEAAVLEEQDEEDVGAGDEDAVDERDAEEELQRDGGADDFGEVAGGDGDFGEDPEGDGGAARVGLAAGLGEVALGGDAEFEREALEEDRHQVGEHDDEEQGVAVAGAAGEVGGPVAGVHVADGDEEAGAREAEDATPEGTGAGEAHGGEGAGERWVEWSSGGLRRFKRWLCRPVELFDWGHGGHPHLMS